MFGRFADLHASIALPSVSPIHQFASTLHPRCHGRTSRGRGGLRCIPRGKYAGTYRVVVSQVARCVNNIWKQCDDMYLNKNVK